jgi:hypothetical protein
MTRFPWCNSCPAVLLAVVLFAPSAPGQPAAFTDVTPAVMMDPNWLGEGVAWGDFDGDGLLDVVVANEGNNLELFHNDGAGAFTRSTQPEFNRLGNYTGVAWGDYDNDGRIDLYAAEAFAHHNLFHNDGGGAFHDIANTPGLDDTVHTHGVAWADFDGDGDIDLFYATADCPGDRLLRNDGNGLFTDVTPPPLYDPSYGRGCSWADFDNDGDQDLAVSNQGPIHIFRNDGGGTFTDVTPPSLLSYGNGGGVAWGDYDNDGDFDLFVAEAYSSVNRLLRNDGGGVFTNVSTPVIAPAGENCVSAQWGDYDNDGDLDLFVANFDGANHLFRNDGGGTFTDVANAAFAAPCHASGSAWADYDGDGDLDMYLATNIGEPDKMFRNDLAPGSHWIQLDLVGVQSNRSAIDARVEIVAGGVRQLRRVDGGGGYNSQNTLRIHFGLGAATVIDTLRIRWPSGIVQDSLHVPANQLIRIRERDSRLAVEPGAVSRARLLAPSPNPFAGSTAVAWELPFAARAGVGIVDAQGRAVRTLVPRAGREAGRHVATWDGRDDTGAVVAPGVYFVRLEAAGVTAVRRIVRLGD